MKNFDYIRYIIRLIIISTLSIGIAFTLFCLQGCTKEPFKANIGHEFNIDVGLQTDTNGYYHLQLSQDWQTLHRISGQVSPVENSYELAYINWYSTHYWYIGDTLGYIVHFNNPENDIYLYSNRDTSYITWFDGFEVPTINGHSYQTEDGEVNTMFAPVKSMKNDTIHIIAEANFAGGYEQIKTFSIILE
jgi:hypothetical protein